MTAALLLLGLLGPDIALPFGIGRDLQRGQLHPCAVPLYNALHHPAGPVALAAVVAIGVVATPWLLTAGGWALHIAVDRALGYGLRTAEGFQRG